MATIIDLGDGRFIAGDPPAELDLGQHWCESCGGSGLGWDYDDGICMDCWGRCVRDCADTACPEHSTLHPCFQAVPRLERLMSLRQIIDTAWDRALAAGDLDALLRGISRRRAIDVAVDSQRLPS